jgi:hypothetical protein
MREAGVLIGWDFVRVANHSMQTNARAHMYIQKQSAPDQSHTVACKAVSAKRWFSYTKCTVNHFWLSQNHYFEPIAAANGQFPLVKSFG